MAPRGTGWAVPRPRVCFGLWAPHFEVAYEDNAFAPQQRCADGVVRPTRGRGPPDFKVWSRHWAVFEAAMISLGHASPESLEDYRFGIELLADRFPTADDWVRIATADALARNTQWDRMREERLRLKEMLPTDGWDRIIAESAYKGMSTPTALSAWWETNCWLPLLSARHPTMANPPVQPAPAGYMDFIPSRQSVGDISDTRRAPLEDAAPRRRAALEDAAAQRRSEEQAAARDLAALKCANCGGRGHRWWNGCPLDLKPHLAHEAAAKARAPAPAGAQNGQRQDKGKGKGKGKDGAQDGRRTRQRF